MPRVTLKVIKGQGWSSDGLRAPPAKHLIGTQVTCSMTELVAEL